MQIAQYKLEIINSILQIDDKKFLIELKEMLTKYLKSKTESEDEESDEYDARKVSFEQWNKQFDDTEDLDQYIPEYGMTLREYRYMIYERERNAKEISFEEFHKFMENLINES